MLEAVGFLVGLELVPLLGVLLLLGVACGTYEQGWAIIHSIPPYLPALICVLVWLVPFLITKVLFDKTDFPNDATSVVACHMAWYSFVLLILAYGGAWALHHLAIFFFLYMPFATIVLLGGGILTLFWILEARSHLKKWIKVRREKRSTPESYVSRVEYTKANLKLGNKLWIITNKYKNEINETTKGYFSPGDTAAARIINSLEKAWLNNEEVSIDLIFQQRWSGEFAVPETVKQEIEIMVEETRIAFLNWRTNMAPVYKGIDYERNIPLPVYNFSSMDLEPLL